MRFFFIYSPFTRHIKSFWLSLIIIYVIFFINFSETNKKKGRERNKEKKREFKREFIIFTHFACDLFLVWKNLFFFVAQAIVFFFEANEYIFCIVFPVLKLKRNIAENGPYKQDEIVENLVFSCYFWYQNTRNFFQKILSTSKNWGRCSFLKVEILELLWLKMSFKR